MTTPGWPTPRSTPTKAVTCAGFLLRAAAHFKLLGIERIERVLTDNARAYRQGKAWHAALDQLGAQARFSRPYRPQTNGKACEYRGRPSRRVGSDPGQGMTIVSCVRFVGPARRDGSGVPAERW
jgi:transposase InsO family protein